MHVRECTWLGEINGKCSREGRSFIECSSHVAPPASICGAWPCAQASTDAMVEKWAVRERHRVSEPVHGARRQLLGLLVRCACSVSRHICTDPLWTYTWRMAGAPGASGQARLPCKYVYCMHRKRPGSCCALVSLMTASSGLGKQRPCSHSAIHTDVCFIRCTLEL